MNTSGANLRQERLLRGLSQAKLAELSGVSQHLISAFELQKSELSTQLVESINRALSNTSAVQKLASRSKRYQKHVYTRVERAPERAARACRTLENVVYRELLEKIAFLHAAPGSRELSALSLFSGCGGLSLGFSAAGYRVRGFLELESELRTIYKQNFVDSLEIGGDVRTMTSAAMANISQRLGRIDIVIGGPPCQGFSLSGKRQVDDPRNDLFRNYMQIVAAVRPRIAVLENVRLLTSMRATSGALVSEEICKEFKSIGYRSRVFEVNARDYGVPQHRERVLFMAYREDLRREPSIPAPTHGESGDLFGEVAPHRTFADACSDLPFIESGEKSADPFHEAVRHPEHVIEWLWNVPEGKSAHENELPENRPPSGYNTTYKRQVWSEPASTVQTTFGMISGCRNVHPIATRSLTIREAARIQSFPDSYKFSGTLGAIRTGIGNAVPPLLAYRLGLHLKSVLLDLVEVSRL